MKKNAQYKVAPHAAGMTLLDFLAEQRAIPKRQAKELLNSRNVLVNRQRTWMARHPLAAGDLVELQESGAGAVSPGKLPVLYQDPDYLIVCKRPGMLSNGPDSVESVLRIHLNLPALKAAHRLDRDTSGCQLLAKSQRAFDDVVPLFRKHQVKKCYHVIAAGKVDRVEQDVRIPIDGEPSLSHFRTLDANREASHLFATIETGRTHQIRRHLDMIHHPVLGDRQYGLRYGVTEKAMRTGRQMLHSFSISFPHPRTGQRVFAKSPLPRDFLQCLRAFRLT